MCRLVLPGVRMGLGSQEEIVYIACPKTVGKNALGGEREGGGGGGRRERERGRERGREREGGREREREREERERERERERDRERERERERGRERERETEREGGREREREGGRERERETERERERERERASERDGERESRVSLCARVLRPAPRRRWQSFTLSQCHYSEGCRVRITKSDVGNGGRPPVPLQVRHQRPIRRSGPHKTAAPQQILNTAVQHPLRCLDRPVPAQGGGHLPWADRTIGAGGRAQ